MINFASPRENKPKGEGRKIKDRKFVYLNRGEFEYQVQSFLHYCHWYVLKLNLEKKNNFQFSSLVISSECYLRSSNDPLLA